MDSQLPPDNVVSFMPTPSTVARVSPANPLPVAVPGLSQSGAEFNINECLAAILDELRALRLDIQALQGPISPN